MDSPAHSDAPVRDADEGSVEHISGSGRPEGGVPGPVFVRAGPSITVGRTGCAINLGDDTFLSQAHAELLLEPDGTVRLRDLGSSNGTFVKIPPHAERELRDGDCVRMGREVLRVAVA